MIKFHLPKMEQDRSNDVKFNARSSVAIMNTDSRNAARILALHTGDSESEDEFSEGQLEKTQELFGGQDTK